MKRLLYQEEQLASLALLKMVKTYECKSSHVERVM